jgi:PEP-CTERM motif
MSGKSMKRIKLAAAASVALLSVSLGKSAEAAPFTSSDAGQALNSDVTTTGVNPNGVWDYGYIFGASNATSTQTATLPMSEFLSSTTTTFVTSSVGVAGDHNLSGFITKAGNAPLVTVNTSSSPDFPAFRTITTESSVGPQQLYILNGGNAVNNTDVVVRFTAPSAGVYSFKDTATYINDGGSTTQANTAQDEPILADVVTTILGVKTDDVNDLALTTTTSTGTFAGIPSITPTPGVFPFESTNGSFALNAGDTIEFVIEAPNGGSADDLAFDATVTLVPEPASIAILGLGCLGLLARRRRTHDVSDLLIQNNERKFPSLPRRYN